MRQDKKSILNNIKSIGYSKNTFLSLSDATYFNDHKHENHLYGGIAGAIYFAQNSIIAAKEAVENDVQPTLIVNRKTMVLFKPAEFTNPDDDLKLEVYDKKDTLIFSTPFRSPSLLTETCIPVYAKIDLEQSLPYESGLVIKNKEEFVNINNTIKLNEAFLKHDFINIVVKDGGQAKLYDLFNDIKLSGKKVIFENRSEESYSIIFNSQKKQLNSGEKLYLQNFEGVWYQINDNTNHGEFLSPIKYMGNCWSAIIPSDYIHPGITLKIIKGNKIGYIDNIALGAPNELILNTIAIGLLTKYRDTFEFQLTPEFHRQYFHQVPLSKLIVTHYDPIYLSEVMLQDGRLLVDHAPGDGGWHTRIMRENIAKSLIASGINYANYGIFHSIREKANQMFAAQITVHTAIGNYENGIQIHGGSGGAGLATLDDTIRNEFSHEIGHNYGLNHYPGDFYGTVNNIPSQRNSTWGWDSDLDVFIPNFEEERRNKPTYVEDEGVGPFALPFKEHSFGRDAMGGGGPMYETYNTFTLHTPYSLADIQKFLEEKITFDANSATGFRRWNKENNQMEEYSHYIPKYYFTTIDVQNGVDINENTFIELFDRTNAVSITCFDGSHAPNVYFPSATDYPNYFISIKTTAGYSIVIHVNDVEVIIHKGESRNYTSDGKQWVIHHEDDLLDMAMPKKQGIKVITLVGLHDPEEQLSSYIYPALNGSYGMIYADKKGETDFNKNYLEVELANGESLVYPLLSARLSSSEMNQFHVNIDRSLHPIHARIIHQGNIIADRKIDLGNDSLPVSIITS